MARNLRYLSVAGLALAIAFACRHVDLGALAATLEQSNWWPVVPPLAILLIARTAARARRTQLLLAGRVSFGAVVQLALAGCAAASLVPGPSEGVLWCTQLARRHGLSLRELARFHLIDKALVASSTGLVALVLLPWWLAASIAAVVVGATAIAARPLLIPLGWLVVSHMLCVAMIALALAAIGVPATAVDCVGLFLATSLAGVLSFVPAQLGTFESAFTLLAVHHGVPPETALAAAVIYHVTDVIPAALAGLPALIRISWGSSPAASASQLV